jgi:hypothetical protein
VLLQVLFLVNTDSELDLAFLDRLIDAHPDHYRKHVLPPAKSASQKYRGHYAPGVSRQTDRQAVERLRALHFGCRAAGLAIHGS